MPQILLTDNYFARNNLIETTIDSLIIWDIVARYEIPNLRLLTKIVEYVSASAKGEVSQNKMANLIDESGKRASVHMVSDLEYLKKSGGTKSENYQHRTGRIIPAAPVLSFHLCNRNVDMEIS